MFLSRTHTNRSTRVPHFSYFAYWYYYMPLPSMWHFAPSQDLYFLYILVMYLVILHDQIMEQCLSMWRVSSSCTHSLSEVHRLLEFHELLHIPPSRQILIYVGLVDKTFIVPSKSILNKSSVSLQPMLCQHFLSLSSLSSLEWFFWYIY